MKAERSKIVLRFGREGDEIAVYCDGRATIAEVECAIKSLSEMLGKLLDLQEEEFLKRMELAYKDMVRGE